MGCKYDKIINDSNRKYLKQVITGNQHFITVCSDAEINDK